MVVRRVLALFLWLALAGKVFGQVVPTNDNYSASAVITGTDLIFGGSLQGTTIESGEPSPFGYTNTIWWSWTAPISGVVTLLPQNSVGLLGTLAVYVPTNGTTSPSGLSPTPLALQPIQPGISCENISFSVKAGTNYRIQITGQPTNLYTIRFLETNQPLILKQPFPQTLTTNGCCIFYVISAGLLPRTYQWLFNGAVMPGETTPILGLNFVTTNQAGYYSMVVSNSSGSVTSAPAALTLTQAAVPAYFTAASKNSNVVSFTLNGAPSGEYGIQSSSNLMTWIAQPSFPVPIPLGITTSLDEYVFATNGFARLSVSNSSSRRFFRAFAYSPVDTNAALCINNLRQFEVARLLWMLDANTGTYDVPPSAAVPLYFAHPSSMYCPFDSYRQNNSSYSYWNFAVLPSCLYKTNDHVLTGVP